MTRAEALAALKSDAVDVRLRGARFMALNAKRSDLGTRGLPPWLHEEEAAYEQELIRNLGDQALFGHPVLREVIRADLLAPVAGPDLLLAVLGLLLVDALRLHLV